MPKTKISEFDVDPANNTDINSINIAEGCAPSGINNAIRQLMSDLKEFQTGAGGDPVTVGGAFAANGGATLGDASGDALTINSSAVSIPNGLNFDSNTFVIDATNNNVGIGTTSISYRLDVLNSLRVQGTSFPSIYLNSTNTGGKNWRFYTGGTGQTDGTIILRNDTDSLDTFVVTSSGNIGIGTSSPAYKLEVNGGASAGFMRLASTANPTGFDIGVGGSGDPTAYIYNRNNTPLLFATNNTERMRIDSSGNLLVGRTSASFNTIGAAILAGGGMYIENDGGCGDINRIGSDGVTFAFYRSGGLVGNISVTTTATSYNTSSDYRLKDITGELTGYKERIMALQPKQGSWKADGSEFRGFLAHEFANQYPSLVNGEKDAVDAEGKPVYQGMQAGGSETIADLVAFVKDLVAELDTVKAELNTLKG